MPNKFITLKELTDDVRNICIKQRDIMITKGCTIEEANKNIAIVLTVLGEYYGRFPHEEKQ